MPHLNAGFESPDPTYLNHSDVRSPSLFSREIPNLHSLKTLSSVSSFFPIIPSPFLSFLLAFQMLVFSITSFPVLLQHLSLFNLTHPRWHVGLQF